MEEENDNFLEIIEPDSFCDYIAQLLQLLPTQLENDTENIPPFHFQCKIDISSFSKPAKDIADELVECIEDVDDFMWMYVFYNFLLYAN